MLNITSFDSVHIATFKIFLSIKASLRIKLNLLFQKRHMRVGLQWRVSFLKQPIQLIEENINFIKRGMLILYAKCY